MHSGRPCWPPWTRERLLARSQPHGLANPWAPAAAGGRGRVSRWVPWFLTAFFLDHGAENDLQRAARGSAALSRTEPSVHYSQCIYNVLFSLFRFASPHSPQTHCLNCAWCAVECVTLCLVLPGTGSRIIDWVVLEVGWIFLYILHYNPPIDKWLWKMDCVFSHTKFVMS